jgi:ABC-type polar amino acid transport system ATPase subunit
MESGHRMSDATGQPHDVIVTIRDVHLRRGPRAILTGASLTVGRGEIVALMGASGSGKTTLLRAIAGLETFEEGAIAVDDVSLAGGPLAPQSIRALRRKVGMVFQFHCLFEHMSAVQNIWLAPVHVHRMAQQEAERRALELMKTLGVEHRARALPRELSGGEAQRVAIARALATDPPVLLMDEPTASLDPARRNELSMLLKSLVSRQRTLLIATHDEEFAHTAATRVVHVTDGRVTS